MSSEDFNFPYKLDVACALFPEFIAGPLIDKMTDKSSLSSNPLAKQSSTSAGWTKKSICENHLKLVYT